MRLLFLTQRCDAADGVLGFVPRWVRGLAERCERLRVVTLDAGDLSGLPENVDLRVVGRKGVVRRYLRYQRFLAEAFDRDGFDAVLAHMVPRYALVAARKARAAGAGQFLWYTHGSVDARLRRAVAVVDKVFTASEASLRLENPKRVVTGHGIDLEHFTPGDDQEPAVPRLLAVGRVTPRKDPLLLVEALALLVAEGRELTLDLAGDALAPGDAAYVARLRGAIAERGLSDRVRLLGEVSYQRVPELYRSCTLLVHPSQTGSVDKVVLEAMACERVALTCNDAFAPIFAELPKRGALLRFPPGDAGALARAVAHWLDAGAAARAGFGRELRALVARDHDVERLMARLVREMEAVP